MVGAGAENEKRVHGSKPMEIELSIKYITGDKVAGTWAEIEKESVVQNLGETRWLSLVSQSRAAYLRSRLARFARVSFALRAHENFRKKKVCLNQLEMHRNA